MRPNGRLSMEVPLNVFPRIQTASRCRIACLVALDRRNGCTARVEAVPASSVIDELLKDDRAYGEEFTARYRRTVCSLAVVPAYRLVYDSLDDALRTLSEVA